MRVSVLSRGVSVAPSGTDDRLKRPFVVVVSFPHIDMTNIYAEDVKARWLSIVLVKSVKHCRFFGVYL